MSSWRKSAVQNRSRTTERLLALAAKELLSEQPYDQIRVNDVAKKAGVSVGGFYARFSGKSALLHLSDIEILDECVAAFDRAVPERFAGTVEELFRAFVSVMINKFDEHRDAFLQIMLHASADDQPEFRRRATAFNNHVHGRLRDILKRSSVLLPQPDAELKINLAIFFVSSAARDAILRESLNAYPVSVSHSRLTDELTRCAVAYLHASGRSANE